MNRSQKREVLVSDVIASTTRLFIRRWRPEADGVAAHAMYGDPEIVRFLGGTVIPSLDAQVAFLEGIVERYRPDVPMGSFALASVTTLGKNLRYGLEIRRLRKDRLSEP